MNKYITLQAIGYFLGYAFSMMVALGIFGKIYQMFTPYCEYDEIQEGKMAPALALCGALLGFTIPMVTVVHYGLNYIDCLIWVIVTGFVQLVLFRVLYWIIPMKIDSDNKAIALVYATMAVCVGLIVAFSLIPA
jgi:putative membrane protein